ncbi:TPA: YraN family protein, partial [Candidatus Poribacteria bacterium]|nr:YraN family protein [Candidatus Poribacteria bacterium]
KTRKGLRYGHPSESITPRKRRQLSKLALLYLQRRDISDVSCRFDIISILLTSRGEARVEHIKNAFELDPRYIS